MNILLDTCSIIWTISDPASLSGPAHDCLVAEDTSVIISPISCAEIACLVEREKITLNQHWKTWFNHYTDVNGWHVEDITLTVIQEAYSLPGEFHQDPADRIITATARIHDLAVVTADSKILNYPHVKTIW